MALTYCEVCGVLIKGGGADVPEGVICGECFSSRQVMLESDSNLVMAEPASEEKIQFGCPYCSAVLRLAVPDGDRLHVRCPKCSETFYADSDGTVTAQLEGNTTQVLLQADVGLPNLTPTGVSSTRPMQVMDRNNATRPLPALGGGGLAPNLQASPAGGLELRPTGRLNPKAAPVASNLRASDEGRLSLDTQALKAKTQRLGTGRTQTKGKTTGRPKRTTGRTKGGTDKLPRPAAELDLAPPSGPEPAMAKVKGPSPTAKRKGKIPKGKKASERFSKVSSGRIKRAVTRGNELEREEERRTLRGALSWAFVLAPALLAVFLGVLVSRDAGLVEPTKPTGRVLHQAGGQGDRAIRAINALLPVDSRVPGLKPERPLGTAPVTSAR